MIVLNRFVFFLYIYKGKLFKYEKLLFVDIKDFILYIGDDSQLEEQMLFVFVMIKFCLNFLIIIFGIIVVNI